mmetsp:Transcript_68536/g.201160  ORF Transcript_68536/g.201160 Transcript_68536/m.201160 type:complete len:296 (+) Transcript_68536:164-1051(+)
MGGVLLLPRPGGSAHLGLVLHGLRRGLDLLRVAEVAAERQRGGGGAPAGREVRLVGLDRLEVLVEVVDQGGAGRDLEAGDVVIGDALDELEDRADGVAVRADEDGLALLQLGGDGLLPVGHHAGDGVLQALRLRDLLRLQVGVLRVLGGVVLALRVDLRRRHVEAAAPHQHLVRAVLLHGLLLVQAGEAAVHALVQAPGLLHRHVLLVGVLQGEVARPVGALEDRGEGDVDLEAVGLQEGAGVLGLAHALLGKVDVDPARELVRDVPLGLAVAGEDQGSVRHGSEEVVELDAGWV